MYSCVIVEDEELPRLSLQSKIETYHPDIKIVEMYDNCDDALEGVLRLKPQLLFLDIQLPDKNSLWLIEQLEKTMKLPLIIFTTAFTDPQYLLRAIRISAIDYLNKPVNIIELAHAIEKAKEKINENIPTSVQQHRVAYSFKTLNSQLIVSDEEIVYVQADGNYAQLRHVHGKEELIFERLGDIEKRLNSDVFVRVGRSLLINKNFIHKLNTKDSSCTLKTPTQSFNLEIPKSCIDSIKILFNRS